ncbi:OmpA family protein [Robiginitalea sp. IMCC44478]|uniref:OmpA family protein n=1 Tax=Robiginitalea sp. IMCC44478 TaxID=3459122 RepID=UPI0040432976
MPNKIKFILPAVYLLLIQLVFPQAALQQAGEQPNGQKAEVSSNISNQEALNARDAAAFMNEAKQNEIAVRSFKRLKSLDKGYYVVVGVFKESKNIDRLIRQLNRKGLEGGSFVNPENNLNYVYAARFDEASTALSQSKSGLEGRYQDALWILVVENDPIRTVPVTENVAEEVTEPSQPIEPETVEEPKEPIHSDPPFQKATASADKLLRRANDYFDKMWYAEAADLYETALSRNPGQKSPEAIRRVADAHYFNTNMSRAYYWYNQLYDQQKDDMAADDLFKYAHSLKGIGKYSRAKRLLRLYSKKQQNTKSALSNRLEMAQKEAVLDNILSAEEGFTIRNMAINTRYSEFAPMFHQDNELVFASSMDSAFFNTRRYKWNNQPYLDLYVARMNSESDELRDAVKFSKKINTKYHEAGVTFSPDNQTMYFTRNNYGKKLRRDKKGVNHLKIYRSVKVDGEWTEATEVSFNGEDYSTGHPALSPDGKQLYFVSDMPGSLGETDIFVVDVLEDGNFSEPRNLGPEINTERKEMFPFINNKKLYFSSNGHVGLGGLDIYEVAFEAEEGFLEVRNLGKPINSNKDDFSYIVNEETQKGYFASNRRGGKGDDDIYSFQRLLPEEANENAIAGIVTDLISGEVMPDALVELLDENNIKLKEVIADEGGSFVFEDLEGNTKYNLKVGSSDYFDAITPVETRDNELVYTDVRMRKLQELITIEDGVRKLKTEMIYFDFDKFNIRQDAATELDKLVSTMKEYPDMVIKIESHTDSRGPRAYNKYLSDKRAKSTRDYLIKNGIDPNRIASAIGYGEERLLNGCDGSIRCTSAQHQQNRRSEFIIVKM